MTRDASKIVFCDGEGKVKMEFEDTGEIKALIGVGPVGEASYEAGYEDGAAAARAEIIAKNAPELGKANAYIRELEERIRELGDRVNKLGERE